MTSVVDVANFAVHRTHGIGESSFFLCLILCADSVRGCLSFSVAFVEGEQSRRRKRSKEKKKCTDEIQEKVKVKERKFLDVIIESL